MKVTQFGPGGLPLALAGWSTGVVSVNSNFHTNDGGLTAVNFVQRITANSSNVLLNPIVNFASGSNIILTLDQGSLPAQAYPSNTIRIHSTAGGGGNIITSNGSNSLAAVVNLQAGSGIALGVSGQTITITNTGSGGGGGGGGSPFDGKAFIWTPPTSAATEDDEFNDGTNMSGVVNGLAAKWSKHNLGTSSWLMLDAAAPGALVFAIPTGQASGQSIYQTVPAGDWTIMARFSAKFTTSTRMMWALICVDTSGNGISAECDIGTSRSNPYVALRELTSWEQNGNTTTVDQNSSEATLPVTYGVPITVFLRKSSSTYYMSYTYDERVIGTAVLPETSRTPTAFTPAYIGFGRIYTTGDASWVTLDAFRKVA